MENQNKTTNAQLIEVLYQALSESNALETPELDYAYNHFYNKRIAAFCPSIGVMNEVDEEYTDVVFAYLRRGFEVGFKTATTLLTLDHNEGVSYE